MVRTILIVLLVILVGLGAYGWINRAEIITKIALERASEPTFEVGPNQPVVWQQGPETPPTGDSETPPNIVFILLDDLGINDLQAYGTGFAKGAVPTPNIDRLASEGALFTQAYSGTGTCAPSRAMLLTGRYPTRTGFEFTPIPDGMGRVVSTIGNAMDGGALPDIDFNGDRELPYEEQGLPGSEVTLAETLKNQGYHTIHIGKWHLGRGEGSLPNDQGFDESLLMHSLMYLPEDHPDAVNARLDFDPIDQFLWASGQYAASFNYGKPFEPGGYLTDWWTDESLKAIEANKNRPFFLYLAHWAPHTPLQATRDDYEAVGDIEPHRARVYAAMLRALDRSVGRVMDKLEDEGIADNTIIVLSSDNGGAGYVGLPEINAPYRGWKITLFEGGIRVPLMAKWPAKIEAGKVIDTPVAHIDVMPTLATAAGASLPQGVEIDGQNLLPVLTGDGDITRPNDAIFWQSGYYRVVRAGDWKLQLDGRQSKTWLFDLESDPTEQTNLAEARPDKVAELTALIDAHQADAVPPLYPYAIESPIAIDKTIDVRVEDGDEYVWWPN